MNASLEFPEPNLPDLDAIPVLRWGIIGAAEIAKTWFEGVQMHTKQNIVAVASRTPGKASEWAREMGLVGDANLPAAHDSYEALLARDDIDAIYVCTLPTAHAEHALLAIAAGKHVLIEKPVTMNSAEARAVFAAGKEAGVLVMEAMWSRYLPQFDIARQLRDSNGLGEISLVQASFCQDNRWMDRLWKASHGDVLFDCGVYPISFVQMFLGNPTKIQAIGRVRPDGIDEEVTLYLDFEGGARAVITVSGVSAAPHHASVSGERAVLDFHAPFFIPSGLDLSGTEFNAPAISWKDDSAVIGHFGLARQVNSFAQYVGSGLIESPVHSHLESIAAIEICEEACRQIGANPF